MRKRTYGIILGLTLAGCASATHPSYYKNSNAMAIEAEIDKLDFSRAFERLPGGTVVSVKNLEIDHENMELDTPYYLDENTSYQIEQIIIERLYEKGFIVVERDPQIVKSSLSESAKEYRFSVVAGGEVEKKTDEGGLGGLLGGDNDGGGGDGVEVNVINACEKGACVGGSSSTTTEKQTYKRFSTPFATAEYIIAYRVLDCGVYLQQISSKSKAIERVVKVKLHLRISSTKNSKIVFAGRVESVNPQKMEAKYYDEHQWVPYQSFDHTHDAQKEEDEGIGGGGFF